MTTPKGINRKKVDAFCFAHLQSRGDGKGISEKWKNPI